MPDNKYLWRASVLRVPCPVYLVAQNLQSAQAALASPPTVDPADIIRIQRVCTWDDAANMGPHAWPPAPPAPPIEEPTP